MSLGCVQAANDPDSHQAAADQVTVPVECGEQSQLCATNNENDTPVCNSARRRIFESRTRPIIEATLRGWDSGIRQISFGITDPNPVLRNPGQGTETATPFAARVFYVAGLGDTDLQFQAGATTECGLAYVWPRAAWYNDRQAQNSIGSEEYPGFERCRVTAEHVAQAIDVRFNIDSQSDDATSIYLNNVFVQSGGPGPGQSGFDLHRAATQHEIWKFFFRYPGTSASTQDRIAIYFESSTCTPVSWIEG